MRHVQAWKQEGSLSAWRYLESTRNHPGWHLTADTRGCASLIELLDAAALDGMEGHRTLKIDRPTPTQLTVPNNRHAAWTAPPSLKIVFEREPAQWRLRDGGERLELLLGTEMLSRLRCGMADIAAGRGDYAMGGRGEQSLWFWWHPPS